MIIFQDDAVLVNGYNLQYHIDSSEKDNYLVRIFGWAILVNVPSYSVDCKVDFKGQQYNFSLKPHKVSRPDVTKDRRNQVNYDESGFLLEIPVQNVGPDNYDVYLTFRKKDSNEVVASFPCISIQIT